VIQHFVQALEAVDVIEARSRRNEEGLRGKPCGSMASASSTRAETDHQECWRQGWEGAAWGLTAIEFDPWENNEPPVFRKKVGLRCQSPPPLLRRPVAQTAGRGDQ